MMKDVTKLRKEVKESFPPAPKTTQHDERHYKSKKES